MNEPHLGLSINIWNWGSDVRHDPSSFGGGPLTSPDRLHKSGEISPFGLDERYGGKYTNTHSTLIGEAHSRVCASEDLTEITPLN